jgi:hypothetical protein
MTSNGKKIQLNDPNSPPITPSKPEHKEKNVLYETFKFLLGIFLPLLLGFLIFVIFKILTLKKIKK